MINKFDFYCLIVKINDKFYPIQIEFYNPYTCYLYNNGLISTFNTFKEANKYKNKILEWKKQKKLLSPFFFDYITIAEISEIKYYKKGVINEVKKYNKTYM